MVSESKKQLVQSLIKTIQDSPIVGVVNLQNLPAQQLQKMRELLLKDDVTIRMQRKKLLFLALKESKKENIEQLSEKIKGMPALIFSNSNPFTLYATIQKKKSEAPAKAGQIAPKDVVVKAGATNFAPGPIISELASVGIKTKVENGKLAITEDTVVVKEGDEISQNAAEMLKRLDIKPMEVGLDLVAVWENGTIFDAKQLHVDEAEYQQNFITAAQWGINLAVEMAYPTSETTEMLLQKAFMDSKALSLEQNIITDITAEDILAKVERQALSLKDAAGVEVGAVEEAPAEKEAAPAEEEKPEAVEEPEAPEEKPEPKGDPVEKKEAAPVEEKEEPKEDKPEETPAEAKEVPTPEEPKAEEVETDVPVDKLPEAVKEAVESAVPGATIKEAELEVEDGKHQYEVEVEKDGKKIEVEVSPSGEVLDVEDEEPEEPKESTPEEPKGEETPAADKPAQVAEPQEESQDKPAEEPKSEGKPEPKEDPVEEKKEAAAPVEEKEEPKQEKATESPTEKPVSNDPNIPSAEDLIKATQDKFEEVAPVKETAESLVAEEKAVAAEEKKEEIVSEETKEMEEAEKLFHQLKKTGTLRDQK